MKFCTAINCIDGRIQIPVINYLQKRFEAPWVDTITEPGPILVLTEQKAQDTIRSIYDRVSISKDVHFSGQMAVVGHHDCARNPQPAEVQHGQIKESVAILKENYPDMEVIGLYVDHNWEVQEIC